MKLSHHSQTRLAEERARRRSGDRGYVLVMFSLLLVPLLLMAGLSIDVGSWYNRASDMRKAADAAALAGVIWLPDEGAAQTAALAAAARNGFTPGNGVSITVTPSTQFDRRLRVSITDDQVGSFLWGNLGGRDITLTRTSFAEYVLPVPLGSPRNFFGTGPLVSADPELLFQSVNPFCTSKVQGDRHQAGHFSDGPPGHCASTNNMPPASGAEYRADGYELYIEAPENRPAAIDVLLYDPRYNSAGVDPGAPDEPAVWTIGNYTANWQCPAPPNGGSYGRNGAYCWYNNWQRFNGPIAYWNGSAWVGVQSGLTPWTQYIRPYNLSSSGPDSYLSNSNEEDFTYTLYAENSPFTADDDVQVCQQTYSRNTAFNRTFLGSTRWNLLCTIPTSWPDGRYILRVQNEGSGSTSDRGNGSNQWGLVARYTNGAGNLGNGLCDGRSWALCPRVYGKDAISVYANTTQGVAQFFLAEIEAVHVGKKLILELWDPGEGGSSLRILQPSGAGWSRKNMSWRSLNNDGSIHLSGQSSTQTIDVTGSRFNGKLLEITIDLEGYNPSPSNEWWKIEYEFNDPGRPNVTDRTTWTARIVGDPVHLVEEY